ncbi:flagellar basal body L-ring protein FlgH [Phaeovibrio sulfidiphilus]|uniref:Flagellar L-ring protein n=1 Tax=Phaeovibrio sulfidiphilus TaxID=1220600 RepID=A0A8J6YY21_9PROT|nr:flagellar basal body L-ring protein FlgH [Phaeovibrio sulfidiphilus]MBE1237782.1 flagellar basal body L-ring protein FlgH [Phaeovibrio sulfidiphilus]
MPQRSPFLSVARLALVLAGVSVLGACGVMKRMSEVGNGPQVSAIDNPTLARDYRPVSMPMPAPEIAQPNPNSLWRPGARAFFKDQRANDVGDIVTVIVNFSDTAMFSNSLKRAKAGKNSANATNLLGFEKYLDDFLPEGVDKTSLFKFGAEGTTGNNGMINRNERLNLRVAAVIIQVLPNGNLVLAAKQEVRVNGEIRELGVTGIIRPVDIRADNTITWNQIAEARVRYGGRGTLSDMVEPKYGQQVYDILFPF